MTEAVITKMKTQSITLPKAWKGKQVLMRVSGDMATITKLSSSPQIFSKSEIDSLRKLGRKITKSTLRKALSKG